MSAPVRVVVATGNRGKLAEIRALLEGLPIELCSLAEVGPVELPEEGTDYAANAAAKAQAVADQLGEIAVGDDSGLEVGALGGAPGPLSARYGGPGLDDAGRVQHLLGALDRAGASARDARFVCFASLARPGAEAQTVAGECAGRIARAPFGEGGFGYDPVFVPDGYDVSMAEIPADVKNRISHRARAFIALLPALREAIRDRARPGGPSRTR